MSLSLCHINWNAVLVITCTEYLTIKYNYRQHGCQITKTVVEGYVEGRQRRGRPRKLYMDNIKQWRKMTTSQCVRAAIRWPTIKHDLPERRRYSSTCHERTPSGPGKSVRTLQVAAHQRDGWARQKCPYIAGGRSSEGRMGTLK